MKKLTALLLFSSLCIFVLKAQTVSLNLHGGYSSNNASNDYLYDETGNGFSVGMGVGYHINQYFSAQVELSYEKKGDKGSPFLYSNINGPVTHTSTLTLQYLTVPVMMQINLPFNRFGLSLKSGYYLGYLLDGYGEVKYNETVTNTTTSYSDIDFGLTGGLGMYYALNEKIKLTGEWRNSFGFASISDSRESSNRNNLFQLGVQYQLTAKN